MYNVLNKLTEPILNLCNSLHCTLNYKYSLIQTKIHGRKSIKK